MQQTPAARTAAARPAVAKAAVAAITMMRPACPLKAKEAVVEKDTILWNSARGPVSFARYAGIMGIINITSDSFYAESRETDTDKAVERALEMVRSGADLIDLGAESSRPGSQPVSAETETARLLPVLDALAGHKECCPISVDTYHAKTAAAVLEHGATVINDISACSFDPGLTDVLVQYKPAYVLMHCQGTPATMQDCPHYDNVTDEVAAFFSRHIERLVAAGLPEENIILDPGIGFGKKCGHNLALMAHPEAWASLGRPSLMALSMKSVFQDLLGLPVEKRGQATQVATALTYERGYRWHRLHDVASARQTLDLCGAMQGTSSL